MSHYLQNDLNELPQGDLKVIRDANKLNDFVSWTVKKFRCGKQHVLERFAPEKCKRSSDAAFEQLNSSFETERLAYERYVSLLNEYSLQLEALADLEKELCVIFGELVPLESRGLSQAAEKSNNQPLNVPQSDSYVFDLADNLGKHSSVDGNGLRNSRSASTVYNSNADTTKVKLHDMVSHTLSKRRAAAIRSALYVRALNSADERIYTLTNVTMRDVASAFATATEARLEFDAIRGDADKGAPLHNNVSIARECYEQAKRDASFKTDLLNSNKVRVMERAVIQLNASAHGFYSAQCDSLCNTLRQFSVSIPADLNSLVTDRVILSNVLKPDAETGAIVNVRSFARTVSLSALQVKTYTRVRINDMWSRPKPSSNSN